jgi:uncharacterized membrane protein YccC
MPAGANLGYAPPRSQHRARAFVIRCRVRASQICRRAPLGPPPSPWAWGAPLLLVRFGSIAVARSWGSATAGRPPQGANATDPQDRRRSHVRGNLRRRLPARGNCRPR